MNAPDGLRCTCCNSDTLVPMLNAPDHHGDQCMILHCRTCCALVPGYQAPEPATLLHQQTYHENYWKEEDDAITLREAEEVKGIVRYYKTMLDDLPADGCILDLGGGRGLLTKALLDFDYDAYGCEPSPGLVERGRSLLGLSAKRYLQLDIDAFVTENRAASRKCSAVFMWHVIEHLQNPLDQLLKVRDLLDEAGVLICQGPLLSPHYVFPEHRFLHSESNITWLARALDMKIILMDALSRERFVSFVLARHAHPAPALNTVFITEVMDATGSLYYSLAKALELSLLHKRDLVGDS